MKTKLLYGLAMAFVALTSCESPEKVAPSVERQGLTSLTAIFTSGPFNNQQLARLDVGENFPDRLVIPVPFYYPVTSDDETTPYMNNVRVRAELAPNCRIDPPLTVLDLTRETPFTFTDAQGNKKNFVITGERVKSNACELISFSIEEPALSGVIDKATKTVSVITAENLEEVLASVEVSAHATVSPDIEGKPMNFNDPVTLTVIAHDGVTKAEYKIIKDVPAKLDFGFDRNSIEQLFNMDPVANLGMPDYTTSIGPSLAVSKGRVVICLGNGSAPTVINGSTGAKIGELPLGAAEPGSVTNDEAEHILITNHAMGNEQVNIYRANSTKDTPVLFHSFKNPQSCPVGAKMKCIGDIDKDALITYTIEGISGVTSSSSYLQLTVRGGVVTDTQVVNLAGAGLSWGAAPVNVTTVVPRTVNPADGIFESYYGGGSQLNHVAPDLTVTGRFSNDSSGWGLNANCLDSKQFNNQNYMALFVVSHFPHWGMGPQLFLYNVTDMAKWAGSNAWDLQCLEISNKNLEWYQKANAGIASGDVVIGTTSDGYKIFIYYYDHNSGLIGGYVADCIKR